MFLLQQIILHSVQLTQFSKWLTQVIIRNMGLIAVEVKLHRLYAPSTLRYHHDGKIGDKQDYTDRNLKMLFQPAVPVWLQKMIAV